jgi:hypothetical protein
MPLASIRLGFLLATLFASLHVAAAPRFWTLTGVRFDDGTVATGYFSYDDATETISTWNVHVDQRFLVLFPAFTYVPGNSRPSTFQAPFAVPPTLGFSAAALGRQPGDDFESGRRLQITPLTALDGSNATVPLLTSALGSGLFVSREDFEGSDPTPPLSLWRSRFITGGSLVLMTTPPTIALVQVDEFYHPGLRHYFITASAAEKQSLDTGAHTGWMRTGQSFKAYAKGSNTGDSINPVCRFYSPAIIEYDDGLFQAGADSHFFSADAGECLSVTRKFGFWGLEDDNAFQIDLPDKTSGACPSGTIPVYRLWNQRTDSNHRYTTSAAIKAQMIADGYLAEGYGADGAVMCAVQ